MTPYSYLRGHRVIYTGQEWVYADDGTPTVENWARRPCGHCGEPNTTEGHDPCLGTIPGLRNACCGHGEPGWAYAQFADGWAVRGRKAREVFERHINRAP